MSVLKEFTAFIKKGNVVDLAVAVVIGGAFGKIVSAIVADLVMPLVNALLPGGDWRKWEVTPLHFRLGDFFGTVVDFVIVAFVIFLVMVKLVGAAARKTAIAAPPAATKACPECLETVPAAAKRCRACTSVLTALALLLLAAPAFAQAEPKFTFVKAEDLKPAPPVVEWKAQAKAGFILTSGNSQTTNILLGANASRKEGNNKLSLDGGFAYGESNVLRAEPDAPPADQTIITHVDRQSVVTTNSWFGKGRYDRFFTTNNAGYASALAAADPIAGKTFMGGGQAGYSRQLLNTARNLLVAELGYDFSYERYVQTPGKTADPVSIHSARIFVGETLKVTSATGANASVETFLNLNKEGQALNVNTGATGVDPFHDTRVVGKLGFSTTLHKSLSVSMGYTVRYDQNPAPLPIPSGAPSGAMFATGFQPFALKTDTTAEATLLYTFL